MNVGQEVVAGGLESIGRPFVNITCRLSPTEWHQKLAAGRRSRKPRDWFSLPRNIRFAFLQKCPMGELT
jgi:hypothetical protein